MAEQMGSSSRDAATSETSRRLPIGILLGALVIVAGVIAWKVWPRHLPPASDTLAVAKLVNSSDFASVPEPKRRQYIQALRKKSDAMATGLTTGKLTQAEYDVAMSYVWLARQLDHMDGYFALPSGPQREKFVNDLAEKSRKAGPASNPAIRDEKSRQRAIDQWMADWPGDRRAQWEEFRKASKAKKT
ncbi:MAG TPA: hypothetical protein VGQ99_12795 [Tepidisphaeraceae bacterium]|jgi:hypothetical protein|nr:hypothetical protein [Tepidisphaeraceae bacterium]HEV8606243.1 hypothetical protein [Tepidisphaeraceae bacterium]